MCVLIVCTEVDENFINKQREIGISIIIIRHNYKWLMLLVLVNLKYILAIDYFDLITHCGFTKNAWSL